MAADASRRPLHERVAEALDEAGELTGSALVDFVRRARASDTELVAEVERLMDAKIPGVLDRATDPDGIGAAVRAAAHDAVRNADDDRPVDSIGAYRVIREIGRGGMGVVYEAEQSNPRRRVAVKVINAMTRDASARLRREAAVMGRLKHPGIAQVFEAGHDPRLGPYIVMEYVQGHGLLEFAAANGYSLSERVALLAAVCDAVHAAHQRGIIHRDLKPSNVLVETLPDGSATPRVLDFGVAQLTDPDAGATVSLTRPLDEARIVGTLGYMSPEAIDPALGPDGVDIRTDVYALGVLLYQLVAGRMPIDVSGAGLTEAARRVLSNDPVPLEQIVPAARGDLSIIASAALEKQRSRRYASAAALAADLRRFLTRQPISARPATLTYQLRKLASRHRGLAWGIGAGGASLALGTMVATFFAISENHQRARAESALELAERRVYAASVAAAARAAAQSDSDAAQDALAQAPPSLRGWEWSFLSRMADGAVSAAPASAGSSIPIGARADGRVIVVYSGILAIVDPATWKTEASVPVAPPPRQFAVSPAGDLIAHWSAGSVRVLDAGTLAPLWTQNAVSRIERGAFSTGGALVAHTRDGLGTTVFDARHGDVLGEFDALAPPGGGALFGADPERWYEVGFGQRVAARRRENGRVEWLSDLSGAWRSVAGIEAPVLLEAGGLQLLDPGTGRASRRFDIGTRGVMAAAGSREDSLLAIAERSGAVSIWSTATGELVNVLLGHPRPVETVFLLGGTLVSGSVDGSMRLWDPCFSVRRSILPGPERVSTARLALGGGRVVGMGWGSVLAWDIQTGAPAFSTFAGRTRGTALVVVSPGGDLAWCAGWAEAPLTVRVATGQIVDRWPQLSDAWAHGGWSGRRLLLVTSQGQAVLADMDTKQVVKVGLPPVRSLAACRSGEFVVGTADGELRSWSPEHGSRVIGERHERAWTVVQEAENGWIVSADDAGVVVARDARGVQTMRAGVGGPVLALAMAPGGDRIAVFTAGAMHVLDTRTGDVALSLEGPAHTFDAAFSPDGTALLAAGVPPLTIYSTKIDASAREWYLAREGATRAVAAYGAAPRQTCDDVRERVRADPRLSPAVREATLRAVDAWSDPVPVVNSECWAVAISPAAPKDEAERAVRAMRHVCEKHPDWHLLNTLAFCLYRAERYAEALETFERSEHRGGEARNDATDAAGLAMSYWRLGRADDARRWLEKARTRAGAGAQPLVQEAGRLIGVR